MHETLTWLAVTIVGRAGRCMYSRAPCLRCVNSPAHVEAEFQLPGCVRSCPAWEAAGWVTNGSPNGMCRRCSVSWLRSGSAPLSLSLRVPPLRPAQTPGIAAAGLLGSAQTRVLQGERHNSSVKLVCGFWKISHACQKQKPRERFLSCRKGEVLFMWRCSISVVQASGDVAWEEE